MSCGFDSNSSPTTESTIAADYPSSTSTFLKHQQQPSSTTTPGENGIGIVSAVVGLSGLQQQQTRTDVRVKLTAASEDSDMNI